MPGLTLALSDLTLSSDHLSWRVSCAWGLNSTLDEMFEPCSTVNPVTAEWDGGMRGMRTAFPAALVRSPEAWRLQSELSCDFTVMACDAEKGRHRDMRLRGGKSPDNCVHAFFLLHIFRPEVKKRGSWYWGNLVFGVTLLEKKKKKSALEQE